MIKTNLKSLQSRRQQYKKEITLISHGYTNKTAWPDGKITVYPWDNSIDQWLIDNVKKHTKSDLIFGLLRHCCDLNGGNVDDFVADEVNVVLLVSRALATDGVVSFTSVCPHCGFKKQETLTVPDDLEKIGEKSVDYSGFDIVTLPQVQDVLKIRPLLIKDEKTVISRTDQDKKLVSDNELRTLMRVITINDSKPDTLEELVTWFRALHTRDAKYLEDKGREITPHLGTAVPYVCDESTCGRKFMHTLSFDQEFFH